MYAENVTESCVCHISKQVLNSGKVLNDTQLNQPTRCSNFSSLLLVL